MSEHADYPHEPGMLYDCEACEAECFCTEENTVCVYCWNLAVEISVNPGT